MFWFKSVLASAVLVTCVIELSSAIECYDCNSFNNTACGDPFDPDKVKTTCTKYLSRGGNSTSAHDAVWCMKGVTKDNKGNEIGPLLNIRAYAFTFVGGLGLED